MKLRRTRQDGAVLPPSPPDPGQVKALTDVFVEVSHASKYGGRLEEFASAALTWMQQQQRGGER